MASRTDVPANALSSTPGHRPAGTQPAGAQPAGTLAKKTNGVAPAQPLSTQQSWGRMTSRAIEIAPTDLERATVGAALSRGLGRSYGDSSLAASERDKVVNTTRADRILSFDESTGVLRAEAGFSLYEMVRIFLPRCFFTPVTPGTKFVTIGGMVASDVHGKNHHAKGCFGTHVRKLRMRLADERVVECSPTEHADLFYATIGGMGLTGHILEVEVQLERLPSPWIYAESKRIPNLDAYLRAFEEDASKLPYSVGWVDCVSRGRNMGRGVLDMGRWAEAHEAPKTPPPRKREFSFPITAPAWALNGLTTRAFNSAIYWKHFQREKRGIVHPDTFFYPLDAIHNWNRAYGKPGFTQYQCVLPPAGLPNTAVKFLERVTKFGVASPLCVLKMFGDEGPGMLSFPKPGLTFAIDFPIRDNTQALVDSLNEFVLEAGGRIYLTKDSFTRASDYRKMDPRLPAFLEVRKKYDPHGRIHSAQSVRTLGDGT